MKLLYILMFISVLFVGACKPDQTDEVVLPTLAVLPSLTPTNVLEVTMTAENTRVVTIEPTMRNVVLPTFTSLPTATITDTPNPTFTQLPTITPLSTHAPRATTTATLQCNVAIWFQAQMDISISQSLITSQDYQAIYAKVAAIPHASCVDKARNYLLEYYQEFGLATAALEALDTKTFQPHMDAAKTAYASYEAEVNALLGLSGSGGTICADGTVSSSNGSGVCSHHGGVSK
jgi:hypothetical protein